MMKTVAATITLVIAVFVLSIDGYAASGNLTFLAERAVNGSGTQSSEAIRKLRNAGPKGLEALFDAYSADIGEFRAKGAVTDRWRKIAAALDAVAMQKDAYSSGLYWYTDLNEAKAAAAASKKPILTLRLLGNLSEEYSCANSRLFRSLLYANTEVSRYLRDNYILHWRSVRPVPRITIDFGDGRKIERTVTGNSIHYILDEDDRIIDALPGLYSPESFRAYLVQAKRANDEIHKMPRSGRNIALMRYRKASFDDLRERRAKAAEMANVDPGRNPNENGFVVVGGDAFAAAPIAMTKMTVTDEISLLRVYDRFTQYAPQVSFRDWEALAAWYAPAPSIDAASTEMIRKQIARTEINETEFSAMLWKLRKSVALDTTRNECLFHTQLYSWLNQPDVPDLETFNSRVYAEMFKTPDSDKWLGLYSTDLYTALDGNGITK